MFGWEFPPHNSGGLGVACLGITKALSQEGFDVTFVLPKKASVAADHMRIRFAGVGHIRHVRYREVDSLLSPYLTASTYHGKYQHLFSQEGGLYSPNLMGEVKRYAVLGGAMALEDEYDVIYAHDWLSFGAGLEAKRLTGKPLIAHVHATEVDRCGSIDRVNREVFELERLGMRDADCVIAVSQFTKDIIVQYYGINPNKVEVVHNGIDDATFPRYEAAGRLASLAAAGKKIVLFVGRITLQKGPDWFLRAARRVAECNPNVWFVVAGSGDMEHAMMEDAARLGIADKVIFAGFLKGEELAEAYAAADLYVMPSVSEPFGITPLEAMRSGTPILISKQSGVSETVRHALKVDFWDTDEMANKILSVVGNPALCVTLGENGKREVAGINWKRAGERIACIIGACSTWFKESRA